jgi:uncharacterized protein YyaL (SSP411 family)
MRALDLLSRTFYKPNLATREELKALQHLNAAANWLSRAHKQAGDSGISKGYDLIRGKWAPSYPETTGYTIPTLLNYSLKTGDQQLYSFIAQLGKFLVSKATLEGGVAHWNVKDNHEPIVFDTGQVIFGWLACWRVFGDKQYLDASIKAGDWLIGLQSPSGCWKKNQHLGVVKVIDSRVAWALLELYKCTGREKYRTAAVHHLDWVLTQQRMNGWFDNCVFRPGDSPITHTLAYTAEGLLECGLILHDSRYIDASKLTAAAFLGLQHKDGSLAGAFDQNWNPKSFSSCLTGNCQIANLWLRFYRISQEKAYLDAAVKAIRFVAGIQDLSTRNLNIHGAIPGSFPLYGSYERLKYPNWATKFFMDSLLFLDGIESNDEKVFYPG